MRGSREGLHRSVLVIGPMVWELICALMRKKVLKG